MNKEQLIALGLTEEQADKVVAGFGPMIPKSRFDEVNDAKKALETQITERDTQLNDLKKQVKDNEGLTNQIQTLQDANKQAKEDYDKQLKDIQLSNAISLALTGKVHDVDVVLTQLDSSKIELDDQGKIKGGLEDQLKTLKESKSFLFVPEKETKPNFKGFKPTENPGGGSDPINIGTDFAKLANQKGQVAPTANNPWGGN